MHLQLFLTTHNRVLIGWTPKPAKSFKTCQDGLKNICVVPLASLDPSGCLALRRVHLFSSIRYWGAIETHNHRQCTLYSESWEHTSLDAFKSGVCGQTVLLYLRSQSMLVSSWVVEVSTEVCNCCSILGYPEDSHSPLWPNTYWIQYSMRFEAQHALHCSIYNNVFCFGLVAGM